MVQSFLRVFFFFEKTPKNIYFYLKKDMKKRHTLNHLWLKWMEELILTVSSLSCNTFKLVSNIYYQNVTTRVPIQWYRNINYLETSSYVFLFFYCDRYVRPLQLSYKLRNVFQNWEKIPVVYFISSMSRKMITFTIIIMFCNCQLFEIYVYTDYKPNFVLYYQIRMITF